jgi:hypothetical protein
MFVTYFRIDLSTEDYLRYYRGTARFIQVRAEDGRRVQMPAGNLRSFVTATGIHGRFRLCFDACHKIISIDKVG